MATLATNVSFQCLGLDGKPLAGGKVYTYEAGTTTPKSTYTTMAGDVPNLNPVILDQNGKAKIFLGDGAYRMRILDSNDALIDDIDQISRYVTQSEFASFQQAVQDGVDQLTKVREQIDVFVSTSIGNQKGFANGIAPLDANVKVDPIYLPSLPNTAIPQATETALGVAKIATHAIAQEGLNDTDIMTPLKVRSVSFGQGQTRKTRTLVSGVEYTNTSNKPIIVGFNLKSNQGGSAQMPVNIKLGAITIIGNTLSGTTEYRTVYEFTILPQEKYTFTISNATTFFDVAWEIS